MPRTRFMMIGGFLGAGKTTAIARIARTLIQEGARVGIVTNDQAAGLVDTASLRAQGFDVGEVAGACFCCKFGDLVSALDALAADSRPDVILTEPVGSCTDLVATVIEPLRRIHGDAYEVGPLVVLCKPEHGRKILAGESTGFSPQAAYIFEKQLEEADVVVVNKIDKLAAEQREMLRELVQDRCPTAQVILASATTGEGFGAVVDALAGAPPSPRDPMPIDYDRYAAGEAELGWLNAAATVAVDSARTSATNFAVDGFLLDLVGRMRAALAEADAEPAHLKVLAACNGGTAVANVVDSISPVQLSVAANSNAASVDLIINARVRTDPQQLTEAIQSTTQAAAEAHRLAIAWTRIDAFRPGKPEPTHHVL